MAEYKIIISAPNVGHVVKDGVCYQDVDLTGVNSTWRAASWDGVNGSAELCDGIDYDVNTGVYDFTSQSEFQFAIDAWQNAYDAEQLMLQQQATEEVEAEE